MWKSYRTDLQTVLIFPRPAYGLGWAPLGGGFPKKIRGIANLTCAAADTFEDCVAEAKICRQTIARNFGVKPSSLVIMITAVPQFAGIETEFFHETSGLKVKVFCTAGFGNLLTVGEPAVYDEETARRNDQAPGTINIMVAVNRCLSRAAMLEALSVIVTGKNSAVSSIGAAGPNGMPKLATGTDCVTLCAVPENPDETPLFFAGLYTVLGQAVATTVQDACLSCVKKLRR